VSDGTLGSPGVHEIGGSPAPVGPGSPEGPTVAGGARSRDPAAGDGAGHTRHDPELLTAIDPESYASARVVVPRVLGLTGARSIIDVGCGSGAWIRACRDLGVPEVVGVDAADAPGAPREVATEFIESDLAGPLALDRQFNLVLCLGMAEHLPPERAPGLVADLTSLAPVVLFSAAVPGQGGTDHLNQQWPEYWVALFEAHGWTCRDAVRPWVRTNEQVAWWYRQSLFLAVAPSADAAYGSFPKLDSIRIPNPVDYLHRPDGDEMRPPGAEPSASAPDVDGPEPLAGASGAADAPPPPDEVVPPAGATSDEPEAADDTVAGGEGDDDRARHDADNARFWGTEATSVPTADDELDHPRPPGWNALKRMSRRVRRRDDA
jgi:SAM-dependent methyltransferase